MHRRQPLPRLWMMTDERQGDALLPAVEGLPDGAGIVFRHYSLALPERRGLFEAVKTRASRRRLTLILAGPPSLAADWGAAGSHGWQGGAATGLLRSASVHDAGEMAAANRLKLDFVFVSPVFETRSHPGRPVLGPQGFARLAALAEMPAIALGGMDAARAESLGGTAHGWAAIDAWNSA